MSGGSTGAAVNEAAAAPTMTELYGAGVLEGAASGPTDITGCDVMISYSHTDIDFMNKLRQSLEDSGLKVWVDKNLEVGVDFLNRIGQAIIEAKVFISLLSVRTVQSRYCQDELALAYVYDKPIYPVAIETKKELFSSMDTGMKLQLARYEWFNFLELDNFHNNADLLIKSIMSTIEKIKAESAEEQAIPEEDDDDDNDVVTDATPAPSGDEGHKEKAPQQQKGKGKQQLSMKGGGGSVPRSDSVDKVRTQSSKRRRILNRARSAEPRLPGVARPRLAMVNSEADCNQEHNLNTFWSRHFNEKEKVNWDKFSEVVQEEYKDEIAGLIAHKDIPWMLDTLQRELEVKHSKGKVTHVNYLEFCCADGVLFPFWYRVQEKLVESYAMKEVFNVDSSVRMDAIQSLARFRSAAVVEALFDLLEDIDPNARAIAAISLAKTGRRSRKIREKLLTSLEDEDRLVRESACIALGYLKDTVAVPALVERWRNDMISSVRDAAVASLRQIGGEEAERAIHMTNVLIKEISQLADMVRAESVATATATTSGE